MTTPGQQLAAMRRTSVKPCAVCGKPFTGLMSAKTCSDRCRKQRQRDK